MSTFGCLSHSLPTKSASWTFSLEEGPTLLVETVESSARTWYKPIFEVEGTGYLWHWWANGLLDVIRNVISRWVGWTTVQSGWPYSSHTGRKSRAELKKFKMICLFRAKIWQQVMWSLLRNHISASDVEFLRGPMMTSTRSSTMQRVKKVWMTSSSTWPQRM